MLKKLTLITSLFTVIPAWSSGLYIGAGVGPDIVDFKQNARIAQTINFDARDKTHLSGTGVFGTLFAGYGWQRDWFYLAGEVNGNISSTQFRSSNAELLRGSFASTRYKLRHNYGVSVVPGLNFSDSLLFYARVGYTNGNFKTVTSDTSLANVSRNLDGFRAGLGLNHKITPHLALRVEYDHINYSRTQFTTIDPTSVTIKTTRITPRTNQVEFGLIYNFDYVEKVTVWKQ